MAKTDMPKTRALLDDREIKRAQEGGENLWGAAWLAASLREGP